MKNLKMQITVLALLFVGLFPIEHFAQVKSKQTEKTSKPSATKTNSQSQTTTTGTTKSQTGNKKPFAPAKDSFSVMLPSGFLTLKKKVQVLKPTEDLTLTLVTYSAKLRTKKGNKECHVMYMDAPPEILSAMTDQQALESFQRNSMNDVPNALIIEEEKFIWNQITGERTPTFDYRETKNDESKNLVSGLMTFLSGEDHLGIHYMRMDAFIIKPRIYVISLAYDDEKAFEEESAKNFFESFRVSAKK